MTYTVNPLPVSGTLSGNTTVCVASNDTLTASVTGGVWSSSNNTVASVSGGIVTGNMAGVDTISYAVTNSCGTATTTYVITVNPLPSAGTIVGSSNACLGSIVSLTDASTGGTWSSSNTTVATVDGSGNVSALSLGIACITYTVTNGCGTATTPGLCITVNAQPAPVTGTTSICAGSTTSLSCATTGGIWSSASTATATVDASGVVTGVSGGLATILYTTGCGTDTSMVTVTGIPVAINGGNGVCLGSVLVLSDSVTGGTWSSSNTTVATVDGSGHVSGISLGTATITYSTTCGTVTTPVTVNPLPLGINGPSSVCQSLPANYTDSTTGGTWSSSSIAIINPTTGMLVGTFPGIDTITFTITATGCKTTSVITVTPLPNSGTITGPGTVCVGSHITLTDTAVAMATSVSWSSSATGTATVASTIDTNGVVTGVSAGVATITYTAHGCGTTSATKNITVNPLPASGSISGSSTGCLGTPFTLTDGAGGGTWSSTSTTVATVSGGTVTGVGYGIDTIKYTVTNSCGTSIATQVISILGVPSTITGTTHYCLGSGFTDTLFNSTVGGTWTSANTTIATIGATTGAITGLTPGIDTITYNTGCGSAATVIFTVNALPNAGTITGAGALCQTATTTLSDTVMGGTWTASNSNATITSLGVVTGISAGLDTILYNITTICGNALTTMVVTVNALPAAGTLVGRDSVCMGTTDTLTATAAGGIWWMTNGNATVSGGVISGVTAGLDTVYYKVTSAFCGADSISMGITVLPLTNAGTISGLGTVCPGSSITLTETVSGGSWSTSNATVATIASGTVSGVAAGVDTILYSVTGYCGTTTTQKTITVNASPDAGTITGLDSVCTGTGSITLSDASAGGTWSSSNTAIATVTTGGVVSGVATGIDTIKYSVTNVCGTAVTAQWIYVRPIPSAGTISGTRELCVNTSTTLSDAVTGGTWSSSTGHATVSAMGVVYGASTGTSVISYNVTTACGSATDTFSVLIDTSASPVITGKSYVCISGSHSTVDTFAVNITGGVWSLSNGNASISGNTVSGVTAGMDTLNYTMSNACGVFSGSVEIRVYTKGECDSLNEVRQLPNSAAGVISIYPNPSVGVFTVVLPESGTAAEIMVTDMYGKVVENVRITDRRDREVTMNLEAVANGTYLIRVSSGGVVYRGKVVIMSK